MVEVAKASRDAELSQMQVVESGSVMALGMRHGDGGVWVQAVVVFDQLKIRHPGSSVGRGGDWTARARVLADDSCAARTSFRMMLGAMVDVDQRHRRCHRVSGQDAERAAEHTSSLRHGHWLTRRVSAGQLAMRGTIKSTRWWDLQVRICVCVGVSVAEGVSASHDSAHDLFSCGPLHRNE